MIGAEFVRRVRKVAASRNVDVRFDARMSSFRYPATVKKDQAGFYLVTFPDVPEAGTDATTREEALQEAPDLVDTSTPENEFPSHRKLPRGK